MDKIITIQDPVVNRDDYGAEEITWGLLNRDVWAEVRFMPAKERFSGDRVLSVKAATIFIWKDDQINEKSRIVFADDTYEIKGIRELFSQGGQELSVEAVF
jgi:head-tail adaptor